ncbi:hyalin-like [Antedon mediterranea]|uniref:hyalin-like n=1 Tax=Antedon mediterranea TaxID=105859 RepID=UPI003AF77C68
MALATWNEPTPTDASAGMIPESMQTKPAETSPANFPIGETSLTYTATDGSGNTGTCIITIIVIDIGDPIVTEYPDDTTIDTDSGQPIALYNWTAPVATDNSGTLVIVFYEINGVIISSPSYEFPIGPTVVTVNVSDPSGNSVADMFTVTVQDMEDPNITCPTNSSNYYSSISADIWVVHTDNGESFATVTWDLPSVSDNSGNTTFSEPSYSSGNMFNVGVNYTIVYNVSDPSGNENTCSFTIVVEDHEDPDITCPMPLTVSTANDANSGTATWVIDATDNVEVASLEEDSNANGSFTPGLNTTTSYSETVEIGQLTVNFTATDSFGNQASCSVLITVLDEQAPDIIGCPMDIIVNTTTGEAFAINVTWMEPTATDNSEETPVPVADYTSGDNMFAIGDTTVQYNISDSAGNFNDSCSFVITVEDNEKPMIVCPANVTMNYIGEAFGLISVSTDYGHPTATVTWDPPVTSDNSNATVTVVSSPFESGDLIPIGTHTITFTATDLSGNNDTCDFYIKVEDVEPPTPNCPSTVAGVTDPGSPNGTVSFNITVVDNVLIAMFATNYTLITPSSIDMVYYDFETTAVFPIGETIVNYTFVDNASPTGNQESCYVMVVIEGMFSLDNNC